MCNFFQELSHSLEGEFLLTNFCTVDKYFLVKIGAQSARMSAVIT